MKNKKIEALLLIIRPANVITSIADVLAGIAIVGYLNYSGVDNTLFLHGILLSIATACLYAGGIIFNDVFDLEADKINRPERVIPSGKLSLKEAKIAGIVLFFIAIMATFLVSLFSTLVALGVVVCALSYDKYAKHNTFLGPINMGMCRGLNLILGMSIITSLDAKYYLISLLPILFVSAITLTAQKETKGKNKLAIGLAMLLDLSIVVGFLFIAQNFNFSLQKAGVFLAFWYGVNVVAKINAIVKNQPKLIMKAVKIAVLSLIPLNASYVAGFSSVTNALLVLCLLPISLYLSKKFPVT
ncbi:4-hydroxybenzoate polyprenyltransferase [Wenyingzhuangia heitensis]|uniref:4-hydroxybenzoate polyprenyltransferase n=1 Tax=Wenyingzhuangia heitensis TaxID=1487859 RepID=A0ABX0U9L1_9FLAO|nr:UbiA-like protein EboC [Wenyingzhuangia heitensis]NIJ45529.1 4-hydroxybenzoate polyprenyltransferase [Wenyingzhuangia heitensis]